MRYKDRILLSSKTGISLPTITKWDRGDGVTAIFDEKLTRVACELGLLRENEDHETEKVGQ